MDGDMNDIFQKLNSILEDKDMSDNLKNILNNFSSSNTSTENSSDNQSCSTKSNSRENSSTSSTNNNFDFDINTILKLKSIMDSLNNGADDPRSNLLLSLKPYLADSKKDKVDKYIKFLQLAKVLEVINPIAGGDNTKNE